MKGKKPRFMQTKNHRSGQWVKIDTKKGQIVGSKKTKYKGVVSK